MKGGKAITLIIVGITGISLVGLSGLFSLGPSDSANQSQNQQAESNSKRVPCLTSEAFHIHPHLTISVDPSTGSGQAAEETVPANIGVIPGCTYELHTHATDGIIHVESAVDRGYVFADFMSLWKKPLLREGYTLKMTVDGKETLDPNFVLKDGQQILLKYTKN